MSGRTEIRELDGATVDRIAAGEVVERPAAAVKELVENSLDAGAGRVEVTVEGDGTDRIRIADDGHGMSEADARLAVRKHTTSKIRGAEDLDRVGSLGFRGEALHAIGAVSRLTITTRPEGGDATEITVEGGELVDVRSAGRAPGTTVEVEDLFYNTPAREKYLGREATEFGHINRVVTRYALANPGVATSLEHDSREVFATTGRGDLREAVLAVYGREVAESMIEVEATPEGPLQRVHGYVSDPEVTRSTREYLSTFVNGRYVEESALRESVLAGYGEQLAPDRFPFVALFVDLPLESVDANVHPRKLEVRFDDEEAVRQGVEGAVREALLEEGLVRGSAPRGRSAPDDTPVEPGTPDTETPRETQPEESTADTPDTETPADMDPATADTGDGRTTTGDAERGGATTDDASPAGGRQSTATDRTLVDAGNTGDADAVGNDREADGRDTRENTGTEQTEKFRGPTENAKLGDQSGAGRRGFEELPTMRVLGQLHGTYLVAETDEGLVLIDQHAAAERIAYERLAAALADRTESQRLVEPAELELTAGEAAVFDAAEEDLQEVGFEASLEGQTARVTAVPAVLADHLEPDLVADVLAGFLDDREDGVAAAADDLLADMACYPALTGNTPLSEGSAVDLLAELDRCTNPYACPHGRPVVVEISETELADRFERDYPGHRTRRPE